MPKPVKTSFFRLSLLSPFTIFANYIIQKNGYCVL